MTADSRPPAGWPLPKFRFEVRFGSTALSFQEVSGLEPETQAIEYRHAASPPFSTIKMPGIVKVGNVTMKRGVFKGDAALWARFNASARSAAGSQMTISLLDEAGAPTMVWTLTNARPVKITGPDLSAEGNEVAIESIEVTHEGLTVANG